jgi:hypothetical protein
VLIEIPFDDVNVYRRLLDFRIQAGSRRLGAVREDARVFFGGLPDSKLHFHWSLSAQDGSDLLSPSDWRHRE